MRNASYRSSVFSFGVFTFVVMTHVLSAEPFRLDAVSKEQAELERKQLSEGLKHSLIPSLIEFGKTAEHVEYTSGRLKLPGILYRPSGNGPFPAVIWNHGSEKSPGIQVELARFYTEQGFIFFMPIREGHGQAPGDYIVDLQTQIHKSETDASAARKKTVALHDRFNKDVVAAVAWLTMQPFVDADRIVMSGVSYGGIQTLLSAEKGLGVHAFVPFAPGAMSFANTALQGRLERAAKNSKAPVFLLQAQNDFSIGPSERLGPILTKRGAPSGNKLYTAFGSSHEQGHAAFACWSLGATIWGADVLRFIDAAWKIPVAKR